MLALGIGGSNHDFSAALVEDGVIRVAIEDERISRHRYGDTHWASKPCVLSSEYCSKARGIGLRDLDGLFVNEDIETEYRFWCERKHTIVKHHLCHAAASFYGSPFPDSALLVIDGRGGPVAEPHLGRRSFETVSIGLGQDSHLHLSVHQVGEQTLATSTWSYITSNSIGWFYSIVTEAIGLGENGEGKTMALAGYGQPIFVDQLLQFCQIDRDGRFHFSPYGGIWDYLCDAVFRSGNQFQVRADLAASAQRILETAVLAAASVARRSTGARFLCYGGGVALNGVANHRIRQEVGFDDIFIYPACGDNGLSVGAAFYGYHCELKATRQPITWSGAATAAYAGRPYSAMEIDLALSSVPASVVRADNVAAELVDRLMAEQVVAVFHGRSEIGPRALGHRSILANPRARRIRDRLNAIKHRESFRPFAPMVLERVAHEYFDISGPSPFMLDIAPVKPAYRRDLSGVCHVDGTARVQTVSDTGDALLVAVLNELARRGAPEIVLNTSFNLPGKPIVETPCDAVHAFMTLSLDALLLEDRWLEKHNCFGDTKPGESPHDQS